MAFLGKAYTLAEHERFDEFLASVGVPKERIEAMNAEATEVWEKNGDKYSFTLHEKTTTFQSGVEFEDSSSGTVVKTTIVVDGNTVTETKKISNGVTITFKKVFTGDKLVVTATNSAWDGVATRTFVAYQIKTQVAH